MKTEIWDVESVIENEIAQGFTQKQIAQTYALAIRSSYPTDWGRVNEMIISHWSIWGEAIGRIAICVVAPPSAAFALWAMFKYGAPK